MRAKTINDANNFERNADPHSSMGIGKVVEAKKLLDYWYGEKDYLSYNFKSLDHIEITHSPKIIERAKKNNDEDLDMILNFKKVIRYVEIDRFISNEESYTISIHSDQKSYDWIILEREFVRAPHEKDSIYKEYCLGVNKRQQPDSEEKIRLITKFLNEHYGPIKGFELVE